jgi:membrane-associated protease RseP (regulator of RpoE activity)
MTEIVLLFLLGLITYFIVQYITGVTRTPWWWLWLVAMAPALILSVWPLLSGGRTMPLSVLIGLGVFCLLLYNVLIQTGRVSSPPAVKSSPDANQEQPNDPFNDSPVDAPGLRPLDKTEEPKLQACFPWSVYYLQTIEYRPQVVICRGQLRSKPDLAYQTIRENIEETFGDRFYILFQEAPNGKPVFVLVPNPQSQSSRPEQSKSRRKPDWDYSTSPILAIGLLLITVFTTTLAWQALTGNAIAISAPALVQGLPYALALMTILGVHELAHYLTARHYKVRATPPYFIPFYPFSLFPFGTFGAFIQIRSPIPHRRALFDIGISGPLCGFIVALPLLLWGLGHSEITALPDKLVPFNFQAFDPNFSLLLALLSKLTLGNALTAQTAIRLHPVAVASCLGVVITALNLMPVGQLDGGHIVHAMFGQRTGAAIGQIARILLCLLAFTQHHLIPWAILLLLISANDEPALNDVTELNNQRDIWGLLAIGLLLLIILPTPAALSRLLNG